MIQQTSLQVMDFSREISAFRDRTVQKGPGKTSDLDVGLQLLQEYQVWKIFMFFMFIPLVK